MKRRPLTAGQLARILAAEDPGKIVVIQSEGEPANDSPHPEVVTATSSAFVYQPTRWPYLGVIALSPAAKALGFKTQHVLPKGKPAVVLFTS